MLDILDWQLNQTADQNSIEGPVMIGRTESLTLEQVDLGSTRYRSSFWSFVDYTLSLSLSSSWKSYTVQIICHHNNPLRARGSCGFPFGPPVRHCPAVARPAGRSQTLHPAHRRLARQPSQSEDLDSCVGLTPRIVRPPALLQVGMAIEV